MNYQKFEGVNEMCECKNSDEQKRLEFAEMVLATEKAAAELCRPWQVATGVLAVALTVVLWRK